MFKEEYEEPTELIRQSIIANRGARHYTKDFSGDVFELTMDMLVPNRCSDKSKINKKSGVAEHILQKYEKLLSVS